MYYYDHYNNSLRYFLNDICLFLLIKKNLIKIKYIWKNRIINY